MDNNESTFGCVVLIVIVLALVYVAVKLAGWAL